MKNKFTVSFQFWLMWFTKSFEIEIISLSPSSDFAFFLATSKNLLFPNFISFAVIVSNSTIFFNSFSKLFFVPLVTVEIFLISTARENLKDFHCEYSFQQARWFS